MSSESVVERRGNGLAFFVTELRQAPAGLSVSNDTAINNESVQNFKRACPLRRFSRARSGLESSLVTDVRWSDGQTFRAEPFFRKRPGVCCRGGDTLRLFHFHLLLSGFAKSKDRTETCKLTGFSPTIPPLTKVHSCNHKVHHHQHPSRDGITRVSCS